MTRPAEYTRQRILKAATELFADKGFDGASVRAIVTRARVNQAAVNYHFQGKEGLYEEIIRGAFEMFLKAGTPESGPEASREEELRGFIRRQLRPLLGRDEMSRYLRIFAWESVRPSAVLQKFIAAQASPYLAPATNLVRRFLPAGSTDEEAMLAAIWLMGQCSVFVRNREQFAQPPFGMKIDEGFVERLSDFVSTLALRGLGSGFSQPLAERA